jgi:hypothetical protein
MHELKTLDGDTVLVSLNHIVRIYRNKDKVTFADGSVVRVGPSEMARLVAAWEGSGVMDNLP